MNALELLTQLQNLDVQLVLATGKLKIHAPKGVITLDLQRAIKAHKSAIIDILSLPESASPGAELEQLRREIGEMARAEHAQWEHSDELDPRWPKSLRVHKRQRPKETPLWQEVQA